MRTYRLSEFVAHEGAVNCVRIGRSTAGVLATGGEDKKVNLWRTGQTDAVKSLSGLQSSVECVVFGEKEDTIAAGGANGTVKVWDMESGKVSRSLTGHRSNCLSLALTTSETNFLVSGSLDCNVKVWDLRRKEAIVTYKGHKTGVLKVATSPDNKWVCSGSEDGDIKVWDLQSGRIIKDHNWRHNGHITGLEFNQLEFLLVSSGTDRTVRVWDLELWEEVECLGPEATAVQSIAYASDGSVLLTATADALKVWGLEPTVHYDTVPMDWRNLADLHMYEKDGQPRALGCCCSGSSVGIFMVNLQKVAPYCGVEAQVAAIGGLTNGSSSTQQLLQQHGSNRQTAAAPLQDYSSSPLQLQQQQHRSHQQQLMRHSDSGLDRDTVDRPQGILALVSEAAGAGSPEKEAAGPLTRQLSRNRTPPRPAAPLGLIGSSSSKSRPSAGALNLQSPVQQPGQLHLSPAEASGGQQYLGQQPKGSNYFPEVEIRVPAARPHLAACEQAEQSATVPLQPPSKARQQAASSSTRSTAPGATGGVGRMQPNNSSSSRYSSGLGPDAPAAQLAAGMADVSLQRPRITATQQQDTDPGVSRHTDEPTGALSATLAAWLKEQQAPASQPAAAATTTAPSSAVPSNSSSRGSSMPASRVPSRRDISTLQQQQQQSAADVDTAAADPILSAMAAKPQLKVELARMASALQVAKGFTGRGNLEGAYKAVASASDPAVACMLLEAVSTRSDAFELNSLEPLIKLLELLLGSGVEQQVTVGLTVLGLVLRGPGQMVHEVCSAPKPVGVDLSFETRRSKCLLLKMALEGLGLKVGVLSRSPGPMGTRAQLLAEELRRVAAAGT